MTVARVSSQHALDSRRVCSHANPICEDVCRTDGQRGRAAREPQFSATARAQDLRLKKRKDSFLFVGGSPQKHTPILFRSFSVRTLLARCDPAGTIPSYPLLTKQQALNAHQALPSRSVSAQKCCSPVAPVWGLFSLLRWQ